MAGATPAKKTKKPDGLPKRSRSLPSTRRARARRVGNGGEPTNALSFFVFSAERQGRVKNPWKKERLSRSRSKRKTVALNLAFPASFSRPSYRSAGFSCSPSVSREKGSCAALFSAARRELARERARKGEKKSIWKRRQDRSAHLLRPPASFSPFSSNEREREESRESRCRAIDFIVAGKLRVIGVVINEPASYIGR